MRNMGESNKKSIMNKYGQVFWPQQITLLQERRQQMLWVFRPDKIAVPWYWVVFKSIRFALSSSSNNSHHYWLGWLQQL